MTLSLPLPLVKEKVLEEVGRSRKKRWRRWDLLSAPFIGKGGGVGGGGAGRKSGGAVISSLLVSLEKEEVL